jgi:hypothetical protein
LQEDENISWNCYRINIKAKKERDRIKR